MKEIIVTVVAIVVVVALAAALFLGDGGLKGQGEDLIEKGTNSVQNITNELQQYNTPSGGGGGG